ncbi:TRAP transporter large permease [Kiloniella sp. EL199]|uniref:TRAP transporter large permease n=1 Tax=Kiloniella sp. EL199 TaxID=2107581 RepID=UPI000EA38EF2|nr:TRAP transporter large permease [Kiloniella sp. EL199]
METILILLSLIGLLLLRVPVAIAMVSLGVILLWLKGLPMIMVSQFMISGVDSFELLAVPLFLLMSHILLVGGVGSDLFRAVQSWVGHWPGGLAIATVLTCALFAAISGSSVATAATVGTVVIVEMTKRGYPKFFVLGLVAAGGTLGILIPPSIPMIIYGVITEASIPKLFLAGIGPGIFLAGMFILYSFCFARFNKNYVRSEKATKEERFSATIAALPVGLIAFVVVGGIYGGLFTPSEAAGVGFFLSLAIVLGKRKNTFADIHAATMAAMKTTVTVLLIVAAAALFGKSITIYQIPQDITTFVATAFSEPWLFTLVICVVLLVMGLFLESLSMLLIMMPVLFESLAPMGIHPIWFGILFVIMIECALITPPVGMNLFVVQAVGKAKLSEVIQGVWPFVLIMLGTAALLWFIPGLAMYIPYGTKF